MAIPGRAASAALAFILLSAATSPSMAAISAADRTAALLAVHHAAPSLAQNSAAQCVNGYRVTHRVQSGDRMRGGVVLKCRG